MTYPSLLQRLHDGDPYDGFPLDSWSEDLQGWGSEHPVFTQAIRALRPRLIVEVGTWKGRSAVHMADVITAIGLDTTIVCVDTWLGSPEHFLRKDGLEGRASLHMKHGYPQLYYQFLANVLHHGHQDIIVPLPQTSDNGAIILRRLKLQADIIYIDAAHEHLPVLQDLRNYWSLVRQGGVLIGDDFKYPDVGRAAGDFAREEGLELHAEPRKFCLAKGPVPEGITLPRIENDTV